MLTFSVNKEQELMYSSKMLKFLARINKTNYTRESISEIVFKILKNKEDEEIKDISAYSREIQRLQELKRATKENLDFEAAVNSYITEYDYYSLDAYIVDDYDNILKDSIVQDFLSLREKILYSEGKDIFRLIELSLNFEDKKSMKSLSNLCKIYEDLQEIIYEVITYNVFEQIQDILA